MREKFCQGHSDVSAFLGCNFFVSTILFHTDIQGGSLCLGNFFLWIKIVFIGS